VTRGVAKLAMTHPDIFRTAPSPARRRHRGRSGLTAASAVCAGVLLTLGPAIAADTVPAPAKAAAAPARSVPAQSAPAKPAPAVAAAPVAACPAVAETRPAASRSQSLLDRLRAGADGARARLRGLTVREISRDALAGLALRQNLTIQSSAEGVAIAKALVTETDAVFDPTLFSSLSYTNRYNNPRHDWISRFRDQNPGAVLDEENRLRQAQIQGSAPADTQGTFQCLPTTTVDGVQAPSTPGCQLRPVISLQEEFASFEQLSDHKVTGTIGASLAFVIGGSASVSVTSNWHKPAAMSTQGTPTLTDPAFPTGATFDPYGWDEKLFWTSSASLSVTLPLPWTKNFGFEGNPTYYDYQLAQSNDRKAGWSDRTTRNGTLEQALVTYWDVTQSVQTLRALLELRAVLEERGGSQKRLFDAGLATRYDLAQIEAQRAALDTQEETAWNALLVSSSHLGTLIAGDQQALILPADAEALLRMPVTIDQAGVYDRALTTHPAIKAQEEDHDASKLSLSFRENQDLPDLSMSASFGVGQTDAAYGYASLPLSLAHLIKPDTSNFYVGIQYHLPIGMNATEAALDRARIEERQSYDRTRQVRQQVVNAVDVALGNARSAQAVAHQSEEDLRLAQCAYDRARDQRDLGLVAEFEVLNKYQDLVTARLGLISARVAFRQAHVHLLAAQGTLEQDYVR